MRRIFLIGPRASGKTTLGRALARHTGRTFLDTDILLEQRLGMSIADFVSRSGWDAFREQEHLALCDAIAVPGSNGGTIIATGGGIVLLEKNRLLLRQEGLCVYLDVPVPLLVARLTRNPDPAQRPSLTGRSIQDEVEDVVRQRRPLYLQTAHRVLDSRDFSIKSCEKVLSFLGIDNINQ